MSEELLDEIALSSTSDDAAEIVATYEDVADAVVTLIPRTAAREEIDGTIDHVESLLAD